MDNLDKFPFYSQIARLNNISKEKNRDDKNELSTHLFKNNVSTQPSESSSKVLKIEMTTEEIKNVSKIQAAVRGWQTRNNVFLPSQIRPFIDKHLIGYLDNQNEDIARLLCRELNTISLEPEKYKNKSVKLGELLNAYDFALPEATKKKISRPFDLWLEMDGNSQSIKILVIPKLSDVVFICLPLM